jgi:CDGSH-type Zn-finger protein
MLEPEIAQDSPYFVEVSADRVYWWCACGRSKKQPFCDSSHKGTKFSPLRYQSDQSRTIFFCGCKRTKNAPLCDGSHNML